MARPIDEKIVQMTLDNEKFKKNANDTISAFTAINKEISNTDSMNLDKIASGMEKLTHRASAMGIATAAVISRITNSAIDMGKGLMSAFVDPMVEGGKKRAQNIELAKFQFEGLGMNVEKTMASANEAVLGTAFGLDEAAVVASQFGATGMRAGKEMTEALRGISGVAAMTGASYSDIGNIFTNVAGNGRLMGNDLLRLGARGVNAAAVLGKAFNKTEAEVRAMVTKGEVSFEDFAKAMNDAFGEHATKANETYTGSLSNLKAALSRIGAEIYIPRYEKLRDIFNATTPKVNDLKDAIMPLIDAFNTLQEAIADGLIKIIEKIDFSKFVELGGITNLVDAFWNVASRGMYILNSLGDGFKKAFPDVTVTNLVAITEWVKNLTEKITINGRSSERLTTIFQGVFSIFSTVYEIAKQLAIAIVGIIPPGTGDAILDFLVYISEMAIKFNESVKEGNWLTDTIQGLGKALGWVGQQLLDAVKGISSFVANIKTHLGTAIDWLGKKLAPVKEWFKDAFGDFGGEELLGGGFIVALMFFMNKVSSLIDDAKAGLGSFTGFLDNITGAFTDVFTELGNTLQAFQEQVKYTNLLMIAVAIGVLAVSLKLLEGMDVADIAKGIGALVGAMGVIALGMYAIQRIDFTGGIKASLSIIALATAITIMAAALRILSDIEDMGSAMGGLVGIMLVLIGTVAALSAMKDKISVASTQLIAMSVSVMILSAALKVLAGIDLKGLAKGVGTIAVLAGIFTLFSLAMSKIKDMDKIGFQLILISTSLIIVTQALKQLSNLNWEELGKGVAAISALLLALGLFTSLVRPEDIIASSVGMILMATALNMLLPPIMIFAEMDMDKLIQGLIAMAGALATMAIVAAGASAGMAGAAAMILMATAVGMLVPSIAALAAIGWQGLLVGIIGLAAGMAAIAGVSALLSVTIPFILGFAAGLLILSVALATAGLGVGLLATGLTAMAALTVTSIAAIIQSMKMLIEGLGSLIIGIVNFVVDLGVALLGGIRELFPEVAATVVELIMTILTTIRDNIYEFVTAGYDIVINLLQGIREKAPELQEAALETIVALVDGMANALENNGEQMVNSMVRLMGEVIIVVIEAGVQMINALFGWIPGVQDATASIGNTAQEYIRDNFGAADVANEKGDEFATTLGGKKGDAEKAGKDVGEGGKSGVESIDYTPAGVSNIDELGAGMSSMEGMINNTGINIADGGASGAGSVDYITPGVNNGLDLGKGMGTAGSSVKSAGIGLGEEGKAGAGSISLLDVGLSFGQGFGNGISSAGSWVAEKARGLASRAMAAIRRETDTRSPSREADKLGKFFGQGYDQGIQSQWGRVEKTASEMARLATDSLMEGLDIPEDPEVRVSVILDEDFDWDDVALMDTTLTRVMGEASRAQVSQNEYNQLIAAVQKAIDDRDESGTDELLVETKKQNDILSKLLKKELIVDRDSIKDVVNDENALDDLGLYF